MELRLVAAALRRNPMIILAAALVGLFLALQALQIVGGTYRATATLLMDPSAQATPDDKAFTGDPERYVSGELGVLQSRALSERAAATVPGQDADDVRGAISVEHVTGSDLVSVVAEAPSAALARDVANAVVDAYVAGRRESSAAQVAAQLETLTAEIARVDQALARVRGVATEQARQGSLVAQLEALGEQRRALQGPSATQDVTRVLDPATLPTVPERLPRLPTLLGGIVVGASLGLAVAVVMEALKPHVTSHLQVERVLDRPVLARFRRARPGRRQSAEVVADSMQARARTLAALIALTPVEGKRRLVGVCAARGGSGVTSASMALAAALGEQGYEVLLVRPDDRQAHPQPQAQGRSAQSSRRRSDATSSTSWPGVTASSWPHSALLPDELRNYVEQQGAGFDAVVLDLPPALDSPHAAASAAWVDDLVLVVPLPHQRQGELELLRAMVESQGGARLHPVVNPLWRRAGRRSRPARIAVRSVPA